jgi:transposase
MTPTCCEDCAKPLTVNERYYYGRRCENCERKAHLHRQAWRLGKIHDPELDAYYGAPTLTPVKTRDA